MHPEGHGHLRLSLRNSDSEWMHVVQEGLLIIGWVAMWRPLELLLYDWWPLLQKLRLYARMGRMPVELRIGAAAALTPRAAAAPG